MIWGIGHDIVAKDRIAKLYQIYAEKFLIKILSSEELLIFHKKINYQNKISYLSKRFTAKEALAKACGTGIRSPIIMPNLSVLNDNLGKPFWQFNTGVNNWLNQRKISQCHLSLSDENHYASAYVILERE